MIYRYGPSGSYIAGDTILNPAILDQIQFMDKHPVTNKNTSFVFNGMEFSYFDQLEGKQKKNALNLASYGQFYKKIASEKSLKNFPSDIEQRFRTPPATLTVTMQTDPSISWHATKVFQVIQFISNDYFRVQLQGDEAEWAYFYHPQLYQDIMRLFTTPGDS
jgi:hypothetical protein